ncbi:glutathione S-transferase [Blumeria hordei DH14]|uniref:Glutathione S-transferase n=1 Tax=Blumeria graminis f. sp. hordei (strain DH14) TaxID=546991 RepID=N1JNB5_BLUG1|nr:glutathione S-transferase [Blumeria hordei DH14]
MTTIILDENYGYVLLAATSTCLLNTVHTLNTGHFRRAAGVEYPAAYAPPTRTDKLALRFNSAQRAHATYTENHPSMVVALLISGLRFPLTAAALGLGWTLSRWMYMSGYSRGDEAGKGRYRGIQFFLFQFALMGMAGYVSLALTMGW